MKKISSIVFIFISLVACNKVSKDEQTKSGSNIITHDNWDGMKEELKCGSVISYDIFTWKH